MRNNIFTPEFLEEIGFQPVELKKSKFSEEGQYGKATKGMTILTWNNEGHSCTYFGNKLEPNVSFGIGKDGGTRTAFNGYVFDQDDVRRLLKMTW